MQCLDDDGQVRTTTERIESDQSVLIAWPFVPLHWRERVSVQVRVWGNDGSVTEWSAPLAIEVGLLSTDDWSAHFITPD